ncbi:MAG: nicotinate-nucleotide adenylyltransferase [Gemmatimonadales bacterium]
MQIGVFGGSFDPPHIAHIAVAAAAADVLALDRVHFIPTFEQPFKPGKHVGSARARLDMVRVAVQCDPRFVADGREVERGGTSYTVDTLRSLRRDFPGDELSLLTGADTVRDLVQWRGAEELPRLARIVVLSRPGAEALRTEVPVSYVEVPKIDVSATRIRELISNAEPFRELVPEAVADYIELHGLYRLGN